MLRVRSIRERDKSQLDTTPRRSRKPRVGVLRTHRVPRHINAPGRRVVPRSDPKGK
ncbi:MAG TPA: hypothetical protein VIP79_10155 [Gemmatimonadaceae bacterium]